MQKASPGKKITTRTKLLLAFFVIIMALCVMIVITLVKMNRETMAEVERHRTGNYARIEIMLADFEAAVDRANTQTQTLSSSLQLTPFYAEATKPMLEAEWALEGQAWRESKLYSLLQWHKNAIADSMDWCVSLRYSSASGCYLGASLDHPDGFLAPDFASVYQLIHLSGQVVEADLLTPGSYHLCVMRDLNEEVLLYTTVHESSGTILIYGLQPRALESTVFSANIGPSYQYLSAHLVLPDGQYLYSSADGEDPFSSSDIRKLVQEENNIFISDQKTIMKIREKNGGFSLVYALKEVQGSPINGELYHTLLIGMGLFILVWGLMALYVLRLLYAPLQKLAATVRTPKAEETKRPADPIITLTSALEYYHQQAAQRQLTIEQQSDALYRSLLLKMMLDPSYLITEKDAAYFQMDQRLDSFALMSVEASNDAWAPEIMSHEERAYHRNLALLDAETEVETHYGSYAPVCLRHERKSYILFQVREEELILLHNTLKDTLIHLNQQKKAAYVFRFSHIYTEPGQLRNAYQEVLLHPDYILSADIERAARELPSMQEMLQLENKLISLIYVKRYDKSYECLEEILRLIYQGENNDTLIRNQVQSISLRTFRMLMESNDNPQSMLEDFSTEFDQIEELTLDRVLDFWKRVFEELEASTAAEGEEATTEDFNAVLQYIQLHYQDPNLSLTNLSSIFHRPIASLSRDFQKYLGKGFLEVLHGLRLDAAEKEIAETNYPMKVIAEHVGYTNDITMNRAFKKYRGVTPSVYRAKKG